MTGRQLDPPVPDPTPDEPRKHPGFVLLVLVLVILTVPFLFIGRAERVVFGLPVWLWSSLAFTFLLSVATVYGILRYWQDNEP